MLDSSYQNKDGWISKICMEFDKLIAAWLGSIGKIMETNGFYFSFSFFFSFFWLRKHCLNKSKMVGKKNLEDFCVLKSILEKVINKIT